MNSAWICNSNIFSPLLKYISLAKWTAIFLKVSTLLFRDDQYVRDNINMDSVYVDGFQ